MRRTGVLSAALILVISACGSDTVDETTVVGQATTATAPTTTLEVTTVTMPTTTTTMATTTTAVATTTTIAPTTSTAVPVTLAQIEDRITQEWPGTVPAGMWSAPDAWTCSQITSGSLGSGSAATCVPAETAEGQFPVLTVLVLDGSGTTAVAQAGVVYDVLAADAIVERLGAGGFCRDILAEDSNLTELPEPDMAYFGSVLYWFMEGMPDRMDADRNGMPCETLVEASVVNSVWDGGWVEGG